MAETVTDVSAEIVKTEPEDRVVKIEQQDETLPAQDQEEVKTDCSEDPVYKRFASSFVDAEVPEALMQLIASGAATPEEIDDRTIELLKTFRNPQALFIVNSLKNSKMYGVQNKPQYVTSVMRSFRDRVRQMGSEQALECPLFYGPEIEKAKELIDRTGYSLEVTVGQRKYYNPPNYEGPEHGPSGVGCEVYIGQIPKDIYEDTIVPLFETCGTIYRMRLMMDPVTGRTRGYAFLAYMDSNAAVEAVKKFDGHEISPGKALKVNISVANTRLYVGNIPKSKSKDEILADFKTHAEGVVDCLVYGNPDAGEWRKNRGFCFVDFVDHKAASDAKRRIGIGKIRPWKSDLVVDWAEQQDEPDDETMATVKVIYVRNLKESVTEDRISELFGPCGELVRVKKIRDYAFVHYVERESAMKAIESMNGKEVEGVQIDVALAKPQCDKRKLRSYPLRGIRRGQEMLSGAERSRNYGGANAGSGGAHGGRGHVNTYEPKLYGSSGHGKYATAPGSYNPYAFGCSYGGPYRPNDYSYGYGVPQNFGSSDPLASRFGAPGAPGSYGMPTAMYGGSNNGGYAYDSYSYGYATGIGAHDVKAPKIEATHKIEASGYGNDPNQQPDYRAHSATVPDGMSSHGAFRDNSAQSSRGFGSRGLKRPSESDVYEAGPPTNERSTRTPIIFSISTLFICYYIILYVLFM